MCSESGADTRPTSLAPAQSAGRQTALERLAAALDPHDHITALVTSHDRTPHLTISSRHADLAEGE